MIVFFCLMIVIELGLASNVVAMEQDVQNVDTQPFQTALAQKDFTRLYATLDAYPQLRQEYWRNLMQRQVDTPVNKEDVDALNVEQLERLDRELKPLLNLIARLYAFVDEDQKRIEAATWTGKDKILLQGGSKIVPLIVMYSAYVAYNYSNMNIVFLGCMLSVEALLLCVLYGVICDTYVPRLPHDFEYSKLKDMLKSAQTKVGTFNGWVSTALVQKKYVNGFINLPTA